EDYTQAIRINQEYAVAYNNRGNAYASRGEQQKAISDYNEAIRINPNLGSAFNNRGNAYAAIGDKRGALKDLQRAAAIFDKEGNKDLYQQAMKNIEELGR
ncbi:MAG: tetratricopeptide repeat protein, partial [Dolichospermum sp.]